MSDIQNLEIAPLNAIPTENKEGVTLDENFMFEDKIFYKGFNAFGKNKKENDFLKKVGK